jgi:hypothetical protein
MTFSFQPCPKASLSHRQDPNLTDGGARKIVCYRFPLSHAMGVLTQVIKGIEISEPLFSLSQFTVGGETEI